MRDKFGEFSILSGRFLTEAAAAESKVISFS
jgi:hypothetical protein